ncbi:MAG: glycosyltransferase [Burkholderia sp.]|nr:glycosyltransferase [Burkholderia sp.]
MPITEIERNDVAGNTAILRAWGGNCSVFHFHGIAKWTNQLAGDLHKDGNRYVFTSQGHLHYHSAFHALKKWAYLNLFSRFIREASGLHFLTQRERRRARLILPAWKKPVLLQPNILTLPDEREITPAKRQVVNIPEESFLFVYLGRIDVNHKGLDLLVQAFGKIANQTNSYLLLVGPDQSNGRQALQELAARAGVHERVRFLESQLGAAKWSILKMADAFVSPSRWEAFSSAQVEAIGTGLPTIVSDQVNAASEMKASGAAMTSPLTVRDLSEAMLRLINEPDLRQSLATSGREWVAQTCSPEYAAERFAKFYRAVLDRPNRIADSPSDNR